MQPAWLCQTRAHVARYIQSTTAQQRSSHSSFDFSCFCVLYQRCPDMDGAPRGFLFQIQCRVDRPIGLVLLLHSRNYRSADIGSFIILRLDKFSLISYYKIRRLIAATRSSALPFHARQAAGHLTISYSDFTSFLTFTSLQRLTSPLPTT